VPTVLLGLVIVAVAFLTGAIVAGVVFTPSGTITQLRVGASLVSFLLGVGVVVLGFAAWLRVGQLVVNHPPGSKSTGWTLRAPRAPSEPNPAPSPPSEWAPPPSAPGFNPSAGPPPDWPQPGRSAGGFQEELGDHSDELKDP
jgi:hypothetical protein